MDGGMFDGIGKMVTFLFVGFLVCLPFAIWKAIDMVWWIVTHVRISW